MINENNKLCGVIGNLLIDNGLGCERVEFQSETKSNSILKMLGYNVEKFSISGFAPGVVEQLGSSVIKTGIFREIGDLRVRYKKSGAEVNFSRHSINISTFSVPYCLLN